MEIHVDPEKVWTISGRSPKIFGDLKISLPKNPRFPQGPRIPDSARSKSCAGGTGGTGGTDDTGGTGRCAGGETELGQVTLGFKAKMVIHDLDVGVQPFRDSSMG